MVSNQTGSTSALFIFLYFGFNTQRVPATYKGYGACTRIFMSVSFEDLTAPDGPNDERTEKLSATIAKDCSQRTILCNRLLHEKLYDTAVKPLAYDGEICSHDLAKRGFYQTIAQELALASRKKESSSFLQGTLVERSRQFLRVRTSQL